MLTRSTRVGLISFVFVFGACGCGSENARGDLVGSVRYNGRSVTAGTVVFVGEDQVPMKVNIDPEGRYRATALPVGKYRVAVETSAFKHLTPPPAKLKTSAPQPVYVEIPKKFGSVETSGLIQEVKPGEKTWDIVCD
jgi:hypothetical protein